MLSLQVACLGPIDYIECPKIGEITLICVLVLIPLESTWMIGIFSWMIEFLFLMLLFLNHWNDSIHAENNHQRWNFTTCPCFVCIWFDQRAPCFFHCPTNCILKSALIFLSSKAAKFQENVYENSHRHFHDQEKDLLESTRLDKFLFQITSSFCLMYTNLFFLQIYTKSFVQRCRCDQTPSNVHFIVQGRY